jgi:hypothetical protein
MLTEVVFKKKKYKLIITQHAIERMKQRDIPKSLIREIIETGKAKAKSKKGRWWVYKTIKSRNDNDICLSIVIEEPNLVIVTTLIDWRPE